MTIYGYVESKEELLDAIALRGLRDLRLPRPLPNTAQDILVAWGRALRLNLIEHPTLPAIFLSRAVIGPGIFHGLESLLGPLAQCGMRPAVGVHAVYAVLIHTTGSSPGRSRAPIAKPRPSTPPAGDESSPASLPNSSPSSAACSTSYPWSQPASSSSSASPH